MEKTDRRVRRTLHSLREALVVLSLEKGYQAVTIRDITERADVAYITFFRHFSDKNALLMAMMEDVMMQLEGLAHQQSEGAETFAFHVGEGTLIFQHVQENAPFMRLVFNSDLTMRKRVQRRLMEWTRRHLRHHFDDGSPVPVDIASHHVAAGLMALIDWWLDNDQPYPPERMGEIYEQMVIRPILDLGQSKKGE